MKTLEIRITNLWVNLIHFHSQIRLSKVFERCTVAGDIAICMYLVNSCVRIPYLVCMLLSLLFFCSETILTTVIVNRSQNLHKRSLLSKYGKSTFTDDPKSKQIAGSVFIIVQLLYSSSLNTDTALSPEVIHSYPTSKISIIAANGIVEIQHSWH